MSVYITPQDELHVEHEGIALTCPHCQTLTHITAAATPRLWKIKSSPRVADGLRPTWLKNAARE